MVTADLGRTVRALEARQRAMLEHVEALVTCESPSSVPATVGTCADLVVGITSDLLGATGERLDVDGVPHRRWTFGTGPRRVLLLGHFDTVWPLGTLDEIPFAVADDRITGPGCFDMKVGVVMALHALAVQDDLDGITLLLTGDEEVGSSTSRTLIEQTAVGHELCLVLEPGTHGGCKDRRKGVSLYDVRVTGRAAHAGLEPEQGANALLELGSLVGAVAQLSDDRSGTTVTPTTAVAGTTTNTVPASASFRVDVRAWTSTELDRVDEAMRLLAPTVEGCTIEVGGGVNRQPLEADRSTRPMARARQVATELGIDGFEGHAVGGGSDGNFTAAIGVDTLDGLGAVGDGAHARHEHAIASELPRRTALVAELVRRPLRGAP